MAYGLLFAIVLMERSNFIEELGIIDWPLIINIQISEVYTIS